jgi:hypothetical protein
MHAVAVRLRDHGCADDVIAIALATDCAAVPGILELADAKLANLMRPSGRSGAIEMTR